MFEKRERFEKLVDQIEYRTLADIAADHCYITLSALIRDKVDFVIASDLNKAPLNIGKANIEEYGYSHKVETRLGSGIDTINENEVESVIIAGIGGNLMLNLMQQQEHKLSSFKQLILQPQNEELDIKRYVHSIGYSIKSEVYVYEKSMYYIILNCHNEPEKTPYTETEYVLGRNVDNQGEKEYLEFINIRYNRMLKLKAKLDKLEGKETMPKYIKAINHIEIYENFFQKEK